MCSCSACVPLVRVRRAAGCLETVEQPRPAVDRLTARQRAASGDANAAGYMGTLRTEDGNDQERKCSERLLAEQ